jgi:hypothetical protein
MSDHIPDPTKMIQDTPRTDEQINGKPCTRFTILAGDCLRNAAVPSEFARTLERELTAAQEEIEMMGIRYAAAEMHHANNIQDAETRAIAWNKLCDELDKARKMASELRDLVPWSESEPWNFSWENSKTHTP